MLPAATCREPAVKETIYDALRESHETQRALCRKLVRARHEEAYRESLQKELRIELAAHAAAEERFLYAVILMDDAGLDSSRHALHEHHEIDECMEKLTHSDPMGEAWSEHAKAVSHEVHHHLREEESKFFQVSGKILSGTQKTTLAGKYRKDFARMRKVLAGA
jgi:hypothetical protein